MTHQLLPTSSSPAFSSGPLGSLQIQAVASCQPSCLWLTKPSTEPATVPEGYHHWDLLGVHFEDVALRQHFWSSKRFLLFSRSLCRVDKWHIPNKVQWRSNNWVVFFLLDNSQPDRIPRTSDQPGKEAEHLEAQRKSSCLLSVHWLGSLCSHWNWLMDLEPSGSSALRQTLDFKGTS